MYNLTQVNSKTAQNPNEDGVSSVTMLNELSCLTGLLKESADGTFYMDLIELNIISIADHLYSLRCGRIINYTGKWSFQSNILNIKK